MWGSQNERWVQRNEYTFYDTKSEKEQANRSTRLWRRVHTRRKRPLNCKRTAVELKAVLGAKERKNAERKRQRPTGRPPFAHTLVSLSMSRSNLLRACSIHEQLRRWIHVFLSMKSLSRPHFVVTEIWKKNTHTHKQIWAHLAELNETSCGYRVLASSIILWVCYDESRIRATHASTGRELPAHTLRIITTQVTYFSLRKRTRFKGFSWFFSIADQSNGA